MRRADLLGRTVFLVVWDSSLPSNMRRSPAVVIHAYNDTLVDLMSPSGVTWPSVPYQAYAPGGGPVPNTWHYLDEGREVTEVDIKDAYDGGYTLGDALAALSGTDPGGVDPNKLMEIAQRFAAIEGYTDLKRGLEYAKGFIRGFQSYGAKRIEEPKVGRKRTGE